jgi:O-antigen ligase
VPLIETFSKRAAIVSLLTITALLLAIHPDATWALRAMGAAAFVVGWFGTRDVGSPVHLSWLFLAPLAPALLLHLTGREGPVVDVVWMAGLTASVVRLTAWSRWSFEPLWSLLLGGWALVLSLGWPVLVAREMSFDPRAWLDVEATNSWAMLSVAQVNAWTMYATQAQLLGLLWFERIHQMFAAAPDRIPRVAHGLWIGVTVASCVALVQGTIDITFLNTSFWIGEQRAAGTMLDANAYGMAAALAGPVGFLALRRDERWASFAAVAVLVANWGGVWMSGSRTGLTCALFGAAGLALGVVRSRSDSRVIALASAAAVVAVIVTSAATISPVQRTLDALASELSPESLWNRGGYGTVAVAMVREHPLAGVGSGAYRYMAPDYWRAIFDADLEPDNAQNWWRHQLAELGLIGGAFILLWSGVLAWRALTGRTRPGNELAALTLRALLAGIAVVSLFGMPTQNPVALLSFFLLTAWMLAAQAQATMAIPASWIRAGWILAAAAAIAYVTTHAVLATGSLSVAERAKRFRFEYVQGAHDSELRPDGGNFWWTDDESRFILPARTPWLVIRLWAHHPDIAERPVTVTLTTACGTVLSRELKNRRQVSVGIELPSGTSTVDVTVRVSRTWRPADHGAEDRRQLGVAVGADFGDDRQSVFSQPFAATWPECQEEERR